MVATPDPTTGTVVSTGAWGHDVYLDLFRLANIGVFSALGGISLATASATYVDVTNASLTWTKQGGSADTDVVVDLSLGYFASAATVGSKWGLHIGSTDYDIMIAFITPSASAVGTYTGYKKLTGIAAGTYTVQLRALRTSGAGNVSLDTNNSNVSFKLTEVPK